MLTCIYFAGLSPLISRKEVGNCPIKGGENSVCLHLFGTFASVLESQRGLLQQTGNLFSKPGFDASTI